MENFSNSQLLMCEKEDLIKYIEELKQENEATPHIRTCEGCGTQINKLTSNYEYDDDTGFYLCEETCRHLWTAHELSDDFDEVCPECKATDNVNNTYGFIGCEACGWYEGKPAEN
jgi:protein-arginine kinase activator protein McsA